MTRKGRGFESAARRSGLDRPGLNVSGALGAAADPPAPAVDAGGGVELSKEAASQPGSRAAVNNNAERTGARRNGP